MRGKLSAVMLTISCAVVPSPALADDAIADCDAAYVRSQVLQREGKYLEASETALVCAKPTCGNALSVECEKLYDGIQRAMPSVVFAARDVDQNDLIDVQVQADGKVVRDKLDGSPLVLDPGLHVFRFQAPGKPVVEKQYTIRAGEKLRIVSEVLGEKRVAARDAARGAPPSASPPQSVSPRTLRIAGGVLAGVGLVGVAGFALFRSAGMSDYNALVSSCKPNCAPDQADPSRQKLILSYASLGVGLAALTSSVVLFSLSAGKQESTSVGFAPRVGGGEASLVVKF